ncbi:hypothetical protein ABW20_dc0102366 [Dactylellina cionopaga]|nr:hypothetical protein ABW20_dc0102366 [Dactylellina cionopaga]
MGDMMKQITADPSLMAKLEPQLEDIGRKLASGIIPDISAPTGPVPTGLAPAGPAPTVPAIVPGAGLGSTPGSIPGAVPGSMPGAAGTNPMASGFNPQKI